MHSFIHSFIHSRQLKIEIKQRTAQQSNSTFAALTTHSLIVITKLNVIHSFYCTHISPAKENKHPNQDIPARNTTVRTKTPTRLFCPAHDCIRSALVLPLVRINSFIMMLFQGDYRTKRSVSKRERKRCR